MYIHSPQMLEEVVILCQRGKDCVHFYIRTASRVFIIPSLANYNANDYIRNDT